MSTHVFDCTLIHIADVSRASSAQNETVDTISDISGPVAVVQRVSVIVADAIVVVITWKKTFIHSREASKLGVRADLSATLLCDGKSAAI